MSMITEGWGGNWQNLISTDLSKASKNKTTPVEHAILEIADCL